MCRKRDREFDDPFASEAMEKEAEIKTLLIETNDLNMYLSNEMTDVYMLFNSNEIISTPYEHEEKILTKKR